MREFFQMGGYAFYVWSSFCLALLLIGGVSLYAVSELSRVRRQTFRASLARAQRPVASPARDEASRGEAS